METYNKINDFKHQNHNYETRRIIFEGSNVYLKPCLMGGPTCIYIDLSMFENIFERHEN